MKLICIYLRSDDKNTCLITPWHVLSKWQCSCTMLSGFKAFSHKKWAVCSTHRVWGLQFIWIPFWLFASSVTLDNLHKLLEHRFPYLSNENYSWNAKVSGTSEGLNDACEMLGRVPGTWFTLCKWSPVISCLIPTKHCKERIVLNHVVSIVKGLVTSGPERWSVLLYWNPAGLQCIQRRDWDYFWWE